MKTFLVLIATLLSAPLAHAYDQIILKNGDFLEGKIFSEVPSDHYDIELTNGAKKRIKIKEVDEVKREVSSQSSNPSQNNALRVATGSQNEENLKLLPKPGFFVAPQVGIIIPLSGGSILFQYGAKIGFDLSRQFSLAVSFRHSQSSYGYALAGTNNLLTLHGLFKNIGDTGFYVGPQLGANFAKVNSSTYDPYASYYGSQSWTFWDAGVNFGYEFYLSPVFSVGPDVSYDHFFPSTGSDSGNAISIMALGTLHFN